MERWSTPTKNFKFQIWPGHGKMTDPPPIPKILNFRFCLGMVRWPTIQPLLKNWNLSFGLDMERWLTPQPHRNFKFQIWPGYGKMPNPNPQRKIFKFQIWPGHGKMTDSLPHQKFLNFRFGLDMERWPNPQPSLKVLNFRFDLDPQLSLNIFKLQIWPGHEDDWPPNLTKTF